MKTMNDSTKKMLKIVNLGFLIAAIAFTFSDIFSRSGHLLAASCVQLLALLSALFYCLYGYKKDTAIYYRTFMALYAFSEIMRIVTFSSIGNSFKTTLLAIIFGALCVLAEAKDLGKKRSVAIGSIVFVMSVMLPLYNVFIGKAIWGGISKYSDIVLSIILCLMILAKYEDKAERGSK